MGHFLCRWFEVCDPSLGVSLLQQSDDFLEKWIWPHTFSCGSILEACFLINFLLAPSLSVRKESPVRLLRLSLQWVPWAVISEPSIPLKFCSQLEKCHLFAYIKFTASLVWFEFATWLRRELITVSSSNIYSERFTMIYCWKGNRFWSG